MKLMVTEHTKVVDAAAAAPWAAWFASKHLEWGPILQDVSLVVGIIVGVLAISAHVVRFVRWCKRKRR